MPPYHVQIDSLQFLIMKGLLLKGIQKSLFPLLLQKHKKYDLKKFIPQYDRALGSHPHHDFYQNEGEILASPMHFHQSRGIKF